MLEQYGPTIKPQEARKIFHWSNKTVYALVKTPGLGTQVGNRFYFLKDQLIHWLEQGGSKEIAS